MAGLGRRTHYRKHLTDSVLHDLPEPQQDERIAKVVATRGGNQFDILLAATPNSQAQRTPKLAILPTKFHKLVWLKRNDFVIVQEAAETTLQGDNDGMKKFDEQDTASKKLNIKDEPIGGIRYMISHILYKEQIKHLQSSDLWPVDDTEFNGNQQNQQDDVSSAAQQHDDGIVYSNDYFVERNESDSDEEDNSDDLLFVNTNRVAAMTIQDDDDTSDEDD